MNTVYIVDDDRLILEQLLKRRSLFLDCGFEVAGAETRPLKALEEIRAIRPDAVLSDLKMPELDGVGLMEELNRDGNAPHFVIISAFSEFKDVRKLFLGRGFDYLVKPVSNETLIELLGRLADRIMKPEPVAARETPSGKLNEMLAFLKEYPAMNHTLESTAERYDINANTVCNLFAKHLNTTFIAYLTGVRMEKARELLRSSELPVKMVALHSGYADPYYFSRIFTKTCGLTPTEYREAASEE
jgi:YesN/AraC family two-component response regulator